ncbi:MAG: nucleotidyltransferase family protein [Armatimonadota bacterium]|nr:nucleotidyltransferase family protein [Armatimonadota bacterium]MDR7464829.1 nucleotidyltransferase family protein [Armatimonadota bacterium]MDR7540336.1 nucleotidyltransferase family protein [Armatimonadota bacterium]
MIPRLAGTDWLAFCYAVYRTGLVAVVYDRLRWHARDVPEDVLEWLRVQYFQLLARHRWLRQELIQITEALASRGLSVLLFKGPALDEVTGSAPGRPFSDLDIMVQREDLQAATGILERLGYSPAGGNHPFHLRLVRRDGTFPVMVEVHFDLFDLQRSYFPDLRAIWQRSASSDVFHSCLVPELTDHLLLVAMQLPQHHWSPRLVVDIGRMVFHRPDQIDWDALAARARAWGMRSVCGAALYLVEALLDVPLPAAVRTFARPENYLQRVQWSMAARASTDQFARPYSRIAPLAACLVVDRVERVPGLILQSVARGPGTDNADSTMRGVARRLLHGAAALPILGQIMISSLLTRHPATHPVPSGERSAWS